MLAWNEAWGGVRRGGKVPIIKGCGIGGGGGGTEGHGRGGGLGGDVYLTRETQGCSEGKGLGVGAV